MKYELTSESMEHFGRALYRIKAVSSFGSVKEGDLGGWIESEDNLSQDGLAWVYGDAKVYGNAKVYGDAKVYTNVNVCGLARVFGLAKVSGKALVYGNARVSGLARVYGNAGVSGLAEVSGSAKVCGDAEVYGSAKVFGSARVSGSAKVSFGECSGIVINIINLCQYNITAYGDCIKVGCKEHTVSEWEKLLVNKDLYLDECNSKKSRKEIKKIVKSLIKKLTGV